MRFGILRFGLVLALHLAVWALVLTVGFNVYFAAAGDRGSANNLVGFQIAFYGIYVLAVIAGTLAGLLTHARIGLGSSRVWQTTAAALFVVGVLSMPIFAVLSVWNHCELGTGFPFPVEGCT